MQQLFQVTTSYFCCGLVVDGDRVVDAAPIMAWAKNKTRDFVRAWVAKKHGTIKFVCNEEKWNADRK